MAFPERDVRYSNSVASKETKNVVQVVVGRRPGFRGQNDFGWIAGGATNGDIGAVAELRAGDVVHAVRQLDRVAADRTGAGGHEATAGRDRHHTAARRWQRRRVLP